MKKFLKSLITIAMVFVFAVALTGCGKETTNNGGNGNQGSNGEYQGNTEGTNDLKNVSSSNYKEVAKSVFGIELKDLTTELEKVESPNGVNNLKITYKGSNLKEGKSIFEHYFTQCQKVSNDGLYSIEVNYENYSVSKGTKYESFETYFDKLGFPENSTMDMGQWIYDNNGKNIQLNISIIEKDTIITFTLLG